MPSPLYASLRAPRADFLDGAIVAEGLADHVRMPGILRRSLQSVNVPGASFVHFTHPTCTELGLDLVRAEAGARAEGHGFQGTYEA